MIETFETDLERYPAQFDAYLKERFIPEEIRSAAAQDAEDELLEVVNFTLNERATAASERETYYFIVDLPENPAAEAKERVLAKLKRRYPDIAFLRLAGKDRLVTEYARYGKLRDLLCQDDEATP